MKLHISEDLSLPIDAATQTFAFIARKGAGKTYAAGKLAECLLDAQVQVVILDSVGNWWGLRLLADGKTPAYDIPVIGGLRGDIPLEATGGHLIADIIADTGRSLIIDISQFSKADRQRFATGLAERLWRNKKAERHPSPLHLIIEESQLIVPESVRGDSAQMVGIYEEIIRLGRNYGIGVSMISQRPQSVNKEVLNQTECLFALQVNGKHERIALRDWITYHGAEKSLVDELPALPVGTAYVWSPQWLGILQKVRIGKKKTFDASATPKVGGVQVRRDLKPLDLDDLKERMASTIEKAKQDDPKESRKKVADLERQLKSRAPVADERAIERAVAQAVGKIEAEQKRIELQNSKAIEDLRGRLTKIAQLATLNGNAPALATYEPVRPAPSIDRPAPPKRLERPAQGESDLPRGERAVLTVLAQYPEGVTRKQLSILTGYKRSSRDAYVQRLKEKSYAQNSGDSVMATDEGIAALGNFEPLPTGFELQHYWLERLPEGERKVLEVLINSHPHGAEREQIDDATGYKRSSRDAYIQRLKARQLVEIVGRGEVKASDELFD